MSTSKDSHRSALERLALTLRVLSAEAVEKAKSGHPGLPLGAADLAAVLWADFLRFDPADPSWPNRDRFVLSAGHGSMLLYSLLHLFGYDLSLEQLKSFRQWESLTPGHPEFGLTPGVECTTGPLGQGAGNAVGLALSAKLLAARYSPDVFNYRVFTLVSDGDLMEGVASESASLAGHLALDNLVYIYDDNKISLAGRTDVSFTESVAKRFEAYGWSVQSINGHNHQEIREALEEASTPAGKPTLICARTTIGFGSPNKAGDFEVHGSPLGDQELKLTKQKLGWDAPAEFYIPTDVEDLCRSIMKRNQAAHESWKASFKNWADANQSAAALWMAQKERLIPTGLKEELLQSLKTEKKEATRNSSGRAIQVMAKHIPYFIGGSADLEPSTKTSIKDGGEIQKGAWGGKNIRFGVREHAMGAAVNGLAYSQCWFPFGSTFLVFSDYMRPTIRLAALSHLQSFFIFTHDSFWVGEDGPTHEPIEHIASLRLIPNLLVFRPADGPEVGMCYMAALEAKKQPSALLFSRQDLPPLPRAADFNFDLIRRGGYVVSDDPGATLAIVATGSEVSIALEAAKLLEAKGVRVRVVSMPCVELFNAQPAEYREQVLPRTLRKVSVEAGVTIGWERIVGGNGLTLGIDHYGASAPGAVIAEKFGFTSAAIAEKIERWINATK